MNIHLQKFPQGATDSRLSWSLRFGSAVTDAPCRVFFAMQISFEIKHGGQPNDSLSLERTTEGVRFRYNGKVLFTVSDETRQEFIDAISYLFERPDGSNRLNEEK